MPEPSPLQAYALRLAPGDDLRGALEIVSLVGTLGPDGAHLHLAVSDAAGKVSGGHVVASCVVRTIAEVVLGELAGLEFARGFDAATDYRELVVLRRQ